MEAAFAQAACTVGDTPPAFEGFADFGVGFETLEFFKRRQIGVLIVESDDEADGDLIVVQMV